jgi:hypothetical protein
MAERRRQPSDTGREERGGFRRRPAVARCAGSARTRTRASIKRCSRPELCDRRGRDHPPAHHRHVLASSTPATAAISALAGGLLPYTVTTVWGWRRRAWSCRRGVRDCAVPGRAHRPPAALALLAVPLPRRWLSGVAGMAHAAASSLAAGSLLGGLLGWPVGTSLSGAGGRASRIAVLMLLAPGGWDRSYHHGGRDLRLRRAGGRLRPQSGSWTGAGDAWLWLRQRHDDVSRPRRRPGS